MSESSSQRQPAVLADGSALFFGARAVFPDRTLNYRALCEIIQRHSDGLWPPAPALFFTSVDASNEKQAKFVDFIEQELRWMVHRVPPHEATICNPLLSEAPFRAIRFDAWIAYAIGRLAAHQSVSRVFVLSDSWPLAGPIRECISRGTPVTVCFFGGIIDTRWHKVFRGSQTTTGVVDFLDLDEFSVQLFDRARATGREEGDRLRSLP